MKTLIVSAHPDDEILGCGGIIGKNAGGVEYYVLILTGGAEGRYDISMERILREQACQAAALLGTKRVYFEDLPNQGLDTVPLIEVVTIIEKYIEQVRPDTMFIHDRYDLNKDHRIVYEAGVTAARPIPGQTIKRLYTYFVASSSEWSQGKAQFAPNTFIDVSDSIELKISAMECYASECRPFPHPRSPEAIKTYASFWGIKAGLGFAEPFKLVQDIRGEI